MRKVRLGNYRVGYRVPKEKKNKKTIETVPKTIYTENLKPLCIHAHPMFDAHRKRKCISVELIAAD